MSSTAEKEITITLYKPFPWQMSVHRGLDEAPEGTIHTVLARRQIGKSQMLANELVRHCNGEPTYSIAVSPSYRQAKKLFRDVLGMLQGTPVLQDFNQTELLITMLGGGRIQFVSAGSADRLRGATISKGGLLCVDEAAFISDDVFYGILLPMTNVNSSTVLLCSTPLFQSGFFYKLFMRGQDGRDGFRSYDLNRFDTSALLSPEKLEEYRQTLPRRQFQTEYLGQFITAESEVFGDFAKLCTGEDSGNAQYYFGIDWATGSNGDKTAICVFNADRQMVALEYFNDKDATGTIQYIADMVRRIPPVMVTVEQNSIGAVFYDLLRKAIPSVNIRKFNTSNDSKNRIVNDMQVAIQNNAVRFLDDMTLKLEMSNFVSKTTPTGKVTYAADGNGHDDTVMAMLIAFQSLSRTHYIIR